MMSKCEQISKICVRCVMDESDPDIKFNDDGLCNHCIEALEKLRRGWFPNEIGLDRLHQISQNIKRFGENKEYDCIIGVSGGVDSSYLLHVAVNTMQLRPLVVHVDAGWNSEIAVKNIEKLTSALNLDLYTYVVDWEEMKDLQLAFLQSSVANQDTPQDHVFFAKLYEYAVDNDIKYVLTGSNLTSESILPKSWGYSASDRTQIMAIHKKFGEKPLKTFPTAGFFRRNIYWPYIKKMEIISPLNYIDYNKNLAIEYLEKCYGWKYYGGKHHESKWTKFFQCFYLPTKFGYDKRRAHLSSMIIAKQMERSDALLELEAPLYAQFELLEDKKYVAKKLGIDLLRLEQLIQLPNKTYKDYPNEEALHNFMRKIKNIFA